MVTLIRSESGLPLLATTNDRSFGSGGGLPISQSPPAAPVAAPAFDFDLSQIGQAIARGNTREDILSGYEVFTTGASRGRALGYAQDVQRRGGAPSLRLAAAAYLDAAGLPRLAQAVSPQPAPVQPLDDLPLGDFFGLPVVGTGDPVATPAQASPAPGPIELLLDAIPRLFGESVYNPPLQSQATGYTPVSGDFGGGASAGVGGNIGVWLLLGGIGIAGYFIYRRYKASN